HFSNRHVRYEPFPDTRTLQPYKQRMPGGLPVIEISDDRDGCGIGRPHREIVSRGSENGNAVRAEQLIDAIMPARLEISDVLVREQRIVPDRFGGIDEMHFFVSLTG